MADTQPALSETPAEHHPTPEPSIRLALPQDEEAVMALLREMHAECAVAPMSDRYVREVIREATERRGGIIGVIDGPDGLEASIGLALRRWWYSEEWHIEEMWTYVRTPYRKKNHAPALIKFAKRMGDELNLSVLLGILQAQRVDAKIRLYRGLIPQIGALFLHRPER